MGTRAIMRKNLPLVAINFLHKMLFEAMTLLLPLYLLERGFGLESIGLVLAIAPFVMLGVRTLLSILADMLGNRLIFWVESISMTLAAAVYGVASAPWMFSLGKILEGTGHSAYWAVIRTESYRVARENEERFASYMQGLRYLGDLSGRILAGAVIFYLGFAHAWALLIAIGILLMLAAFRLPANGRSDVRLSLSQFWAMLRAPRPPAFWTVAGIMVLAVAFYSATVFFLYPIYMKQQGFSALFIGGLLAFYALLNGVTMMVATRWNWGVRTIAMGTFLFGAIPFLWMNQLNGGNAIFLLGALAIGEGCASGLFERMIARVTKDSAQISTEIAVLHIPYRSVEFIVLGSLGFGVSRFGFYPAFLVVAGATALFALLATRVLVANEQKKPL